MKEATLFESTETALLRLSAVLEPEQHDLDLFELLVFRLALCVVLQPRLESSADQSGKAVVSMLAAAAATRPASRNAVAHALCSACCCLNRTAASTRSSHPRRPPSLPRKSWLQRQRGQATYAQAGGAVQSTDHDDPADSSRSTEEENRAVDAMAELLDAMAEEAATAPAPAPAPATTPTPRKPAAITLEDILNPKHTSAPPEVADLRAFRPRRFTVPHAASPESHRLVYQKTWDRAYASLDRAFKKRQLMDFAGADGLNVDLSDPRLRTRIPGKKPKHWKSKRLDQMSKRELIHTILVLDFDMTHPETIPSTRLGPNTLESESALPFSIPRTNALFSRSCLGIPLSDRTLFLLLSPSKSPRPGFAAV